MIDATLEQKIMDCYVLLEILKYCTDSPARSYHLKFAVYDDFKNKNINGLQKVGAGNLQLQDYLMDSIRGKFSSVHPDLAAEGIAKVEMGEEGSTSSKTAEALLNSLAKVRRPICRVLLACERNRF